MAEQKGFNSITTLKWILRQLNGWLNHSKFYTGKTTGKTKLFA